MSGLSYAMPPMTSFPLAPGFSENKENHPPVQVIDLTGDSEDEQEVPNRAEDSGRLIPIEDGENVWPIPVPPPASERPPYTTTMGQRCVRSSGPIQSSPTPMPILKLCKGLGTNPIWALDFLEGVDHSEVLPEYTPLAIGQSLTPQALTPVSASQVIWRCLHQVCEGLAHMQRYRELIAAAMRRVDDLVYNPEGDRILLRGIEVTEESSSLKQDSGEDERDVE